MWHGLADQLIYPRGTKEYYNKVQRLDPNLRQFYRYFEAPGVGHCRGGIGVAPFSPLEAVIAWVERGEAPDTLLASSLDGSTARPLCPYPLVSAYKGGDAKRASSYACRAGFT